MTYKDHFVVEVKHKGKIMRVRDGFVTLPFGSEYSLLFKNLNSRRAVVNISIDGQDVLDNSSLIVGANQTSELKGYMIGSAARNKFKFIKKTKEIEEYRGDKIDDGLIRIEFAYESEDPIKIRHIINEEHHYYNHHYDDWYRWPKVIYQTWDRSYRQPGVLNSMTNSVNHSASGMVASASAPETLSKEVVMDSLETPIDDMGITVKGSEIQQDFQYSLVGNTDPSQVIILRLKGTNSHGQQVQAPVTVQTKITCSSCGRTSKSSCKFCPNCGTFLE